MTTISHPPHAVILRIETSPESVLPTPDNSCVVFEPQAPSSVLPGSVQLPNTVYAQWFRRSQKFPPVFGPLGLARQITSINPDVVYVHLPSKSVDDLSSEQLRFVLEAEQAITEAANRSRTIDLCSPPSAIRNLRVTLLFDNTISSRKLDQYETLFDTDESFAAASAAAILSSRLQNITPSSALWSGTLQIPSSNSSGAHINLDGLHLIKSSKVASDRPLPTLPSGPARILAVSKRLPSQGGLLNTVSGFSLSLDQHCPRDTALFYNMLASRGDSLLVSISDLLFWLFWPRQFRSSQHHPACQALWIAPLTNTAVLALDVVAWCASQSFGTTLFARQLPKHILDLPVQSISPVTPFQNPTSTFQKLSNVPCLNFDRAIDSLSKRCNLPAPGILREAKRGFTPTDLQGEDISGPELRVLAKRQKPNQDGSDYALTYGRMTGTHSRSESCSILDSKSLPGKSDSCKQSSQLTMRQQRFQRLMQSQQDKRGVENASTVSSLGQRGKRVRSASDLDASRRRCSKTPRNASSQVYVGQAIRGKLRALEQEKPFFELDGDKQYLGASWKQLARQFSDGKCVPLNPDASSVERIQGHGVEYLLDGDDRDKFIVDWETLISKTDAEFGTCTPLTHQQQYKLNASLKDLRQLGMKLAAEKQCKSIGAPAPLVTSAITSLPLIELGTAEPEENASILLGRILRAFHDGQIVVKDEALRILLTKTASARL